MVRDLLDHGVVSQDARSAEGGRERAGSLDAWSIFRSQPVGDEGVGFLLLLRSFLFRCGLFLRVRLVG